MGNQTKEKGGKGLWRLLQEYGQAAVELLFPGEHCPLCGKATSQGYLCKSCADKWARHSWGRPCDCCGVFIHGAHSRCRWCRIEPPLYIERARAVAVYQGYLRDQLLAFKYEGQKSLAEGFGVLLTELIRREFADIPFDFVSSVPVTERTMAKRGYNQSLLLAQAVSDGIGVPWADHFLAKRADVVSQTTLGREARIANMRDAIVPLDVDLTGKRILLVDDIFTTGATAYACGKALKEMGAAGVWVITVAVGADFS